MYFDAVKTIDLCAKLKLTVNQFTFCYLVYTRQYTLFYKYHHECGGFSEKEVKDLVRRGILLDANKRNEAYADNYIIQDMFTDNFEDAIDSNLGTDIWELYPQKVDLENISFNGKNISPEECDLLIKRKLLTGRIDSSEQVIDALNEQIDSGQITMALKKWIESEQWKTETNSSSGYGHEHI